MDEEATNGYMKYGTSIHGSQASIHVPTNNPMVYPQHGAPREVIGCAMIGAPPSILVEGVFPPFCVDPRICPKRTCLVW